MRFAVTARSSRGKRDRVQDNLVLDCFRKNWCHADLSLQIRPRSSNPSSSWPTSGLPTNEIKGYHVKEQGAYWFRPVLMRALQTISASSMAHHGHDHAYAAVVLAGGYEEAGDHGRFQVAAGDVLLHDRFEAHLDRFSASGAVVLNLRLPAESSFAPGAAKIADPDSIVSAAERSQTKAVNLLLSAIQPRAVMYADWPDELAATLIDDPSLRLGRWAETKGLRAWTVSRGFAQVFGVSPEVFRVRARARQAWRLIQTSGCPLAQIAYHLGFADQSHMTRGVKQLTRSTPRAWRAAANRYKTTPASRV